MQPLRGPSLQMSEDQFLDWAASQEQHCELVEGAVVMQAGATRDHERVAKRVFASLFRQVDENRFDVNKGDFGVRIKRGSGVGSVLYPDVVVDLQSGTGDERATTTPIVIVEVLSPSTDLGHHIEKFHKYQVRDTLARYVVFEQKRAVAYVWTRTAGTWPTAPTLIEGLGENVGLPEIEAEIEMAEIYRPVVS